MAAPALRPLSVGEILDASIKMYKTHARKLIPLAAVVVVPFQLLNALILVSIVPETADLPNGFSFLHGTGGSIGYSRALARWLVRIVSFCALFIGYLWMLWDPERQCWHDKAARDVVVPVTAYPVA